MKNEGTGYVSLSKPLYPINISQQDDVNSTTSFSIHRQKLATLCRICGLPVYKPVPKHKFRNEIDAIFKVNIDDEDSEVYPSNICKSHTDVFYRYRTALNKNTGFSTSMDITTFAVHEDTNCELCTATNAETPMNKRKRSVKSTPPGRGKRSKLFLQPVSTDANASHKNDLMHAFENIPIDERDRILEDFIIELPSLQQKNIVNLLLKSRNYNFKQDIKVIQRKYDNIATLNNFELHAYLQERNPFVISLIEALSKCSLDDNAYRIAIVLESLYKFNSNFIGPLSILQNLSVLSMTSSKTAVDIIGNSGAGGKYSTLCRWLSNIPANPLNCPAGDIMFMFDNEQIIGKTWNIKPQNKVKSSVITTVAVAQLESTMCYESNESLHPSRWFTHENVSEILRDDIQNEALNNDLRRVHLLQFKSFVTAAIEEILSMQTETKNEDVIDKLVDKLQKERDFKTCTDCNILFAKTKRKCPNCHKDLVKFNASLLQNDNAESSEEPLMLPLISENKKNTKSREKEYMRYDHVNSNHPDDPIPVFVLDPVFVNPNSYDSLKLVLRHIGKIAGVKRYKGGMREWVMVCCDGLPFTMLFRLINDYYICKECEKGILGRDLLEEHRKTHPNSETVVQFIREFDWVYIHIADGHYEMNLMKSFVELNWDVCMKTLAYRMGWTSDAALKAAKNCYDNHKTWQLILVFHLGTLMELLLPYIRSFRNGTQEKPSANGFLKFVSTMEDKPNYMYLFEMVSRYTQAIINFRMGVRRNNSILIQSAKHMSKELFHGRNHPRYQQIEMIECIQRNIRPADLTEFISRHESMSKTRDKSKGQGYDFILEEVNKGIKSWIRKGVASNEMWLNVCRNYDTLNELKSKLADMLKLENAEECIRKLDLEDAICDWRVFLREKQYFTCESVIHKSTEGINLHGSLVNFTDEAKRKRDYRLLEFFLQQEMPDDFSLKHPVFVTTDEADYYQSFSNQTIEFIDRIIMEMIEGFHDEETKQTYKEQFKKEIYRKKKSVHINFFNDVMEVLNEEAATSEQNDDEVDK